MSGISRGRWGWASWLGLAAAACAGRPGGRPDAVPSPTRTVALASAIVLETAGPPPSDTSVSFVTGQPRIIVLRHGPPENIVFAELRFPPSAFGDSGLPVRVDVRPRPGVYGLDVATSLPLHGGATLTFKYPRYFLAPARARAVYGSDALYERALVVGQVLPEGQLSLLPSTRPASDNLQAALPAPGSYLVAAPQ